MVRRIALCLAAVLLSGCGAGESGTVADGLASQGSTASSEQTPQQPAAENPSPNDSVVGDVCAAAGAAFGDEVTRRIEQGELDAAIEAYDVLAGQAPPEIANDVTIVRDGLATVRDALEDSGLDGEKLGAFVGGDPSTVTSMDPGDIAALQQIGEKLTHFITSSDYIEATQNLVAYYSENCTP